MSKEEYIDSNMLIARFMGARDTGDTRLINDKPEPLYELIIGNEKLYYVESTGYNRAIFSPQHLQYHRDWNWLMLVVDKIEEKYEVMVLIQGKYCEIFGGQDGNIVERGRGKNKIQNTFQAMIDFINKINDKAITEVK